MKKAIVLVLVMMMFTLTSCSLLNKKTKKTETPVKQKLSFRMKVNSTSVFVNGQEFILDVPVKEIGGRTLVPLKFVADFLKAENVNYDAKTEEVTFTLER
jgi:hypothetical protein